MAKIGIKGSSEAVPKDLKITIRLITENETKKYASEDCHEINRAANRMWLEDMLDFLLDWNIVEIIKTNMNPYIDPWIRVFLHI